MRKLNKEEFIEKSIKIHGDKYDYSIVDYKNTKTKIKIICKIHGMFEQSPNGHLSGRGCELCGIISKKMTFQKFFEKSIEKHNNVYDYSEAKIKDSKTKIKIICKVHGIFYQRPTNHYKQGCPKCAKYSNTENFIKKAKIFHGDKYDYSMVDYKDSKTPVIIICKVHGEFYQKPGIHLNCCCPSCSIDKSRLKKMDFITKSIQKHGEIYDYSKVEIDGGKKVEIVCKKHGSFLQTPDNHQRGKGCPICNESYGERNIRNFLKQNNIEYIRQKTFDDCKYIKKLSFDFYLSKYNVCIEFDGQQHFCIIKHFGGEKALMENKIRDNIKNEYCKNNEIKLIRVKYNENIEEKLSEIFHSIDKISR